MFLCSKLSILYQEDRHLQYDSRYICPRISPRFKMAGNVDLSVIGYLWLVWRQNYIDSK